MPKGKYLHKTRIGETKGAIMKFLGRLPKNESEYKHIWYILFGKQSIGLVRQRQRHINHGYAIPNANRKYCVFCVKENRVLTI